MEPSFGHSYLLIEMQERREFGVVMPVGVMRDEREFVEHGLEALRRVGWLGALAAYLALDLTSATSQDAPTSCASYLGMESIARYVIVPLGWFRRSSPSW